jgi:uncharacterized protein DUF4160
MHVHVGSADGEAKFWIEPRIELAQNYGLNAPNLKAARELVKEHEGEIRKAWAEHFGS